MSYAPGSESAHMFHLSHFHRLVRFCWFGLVVGGVCLCFFAFLLTTDQPVRSSYQPMTIIAYLHDCHCRYDERSNVQKKKPEDRARANVNSLLPASFTSMVPQPPITVLRTGCCFRARGLKRILEETHLMSSLQSACNNQVLEPQGAPVI